MTRIVMRPGAQTAYISAVMSHTGLSHAEIATHCGVHRRTVQDWHRERYDASYECLSHLAHAYSIPLPKHHTQPEGWHLAEAAAQGGRERYRRYGPPGTIKSRAMGGRASQQRRRAHPEMYRERGCIVRKKFPTLTRSEKLAELVGILLGDGGMTDYQVTISLDATVDRAYARYVSRLCHDLLGERPTWYERGNVIEMKTAGAGLVEALECIGLRRGNKVDHQVGIPAWIMRNPTYARMCVRGLFDTDGGFYMHTKARGRYIGWCFSNRSTPLIRGVAQVLTDCGLTYSIPSGKSVYMYSLEDMRRFMDRIGSSNPKNVRKLREHLRERKRRGEVCRMVRHSLGKRAG